MDTELRICTNRTSGPADYNYYKAVLMDYVLHQATSRKNRIDCAWWNLLHWMKTHVQLFHFCSKKSTHGCRKIIFFNWIFCKKRPGFKTVSKQLSGNLYNHYSIQKINYCIPLLFSNLNWYMNIAKTYIYIFIEYPRKFYIIRISTKLNGVYERLRKIHATRMAAIFEE